MSPGDPLSVAAGLAILALVAYDIFSTVLHHWGKSGPIGRALTHTIWRAALRGTHRLSRERRRAGLGLIGPALIPLVVAIWALLVVVGFAFLYLPGMPEGFERWDRALPIRGPFSDALYFSGYTFFTLGYGDVVPLTNALRVLAIIQTGAGFALITLVISYFVSVYDAYTYKTVLAQSVYYQAGQSADAAELLARDLQEGIPPLLLITSVERLRDGLVRLRSDYSNYPILHFFRDPRAEQSFLRLIFFAQDLSLLLDTAVDPRDRPSARLGRRYGLAAAAAAAEADLLRTMVRQVPEEVETDAAEQIAGYKRWAERFGRARERLRESGIPVRESEEAVREYCRQRREWEPALRACAEALGEEWEEVSGGC